MHAGLHVVELPETAMCRSFGVFWRCMSCVKSNEFKPHRPKVGFFYRRAQA